MRNDLVPGGRGIVWKHRGRGRDSGWLRADWGDHLRQRQCSSWVGSNGRWQNASTVAICSLDRDLSCCLTIRSSRDRFAAAEMALRLSHRRGRKAVRLNSGVRAHMKLLCSSGSLAFIHSLRIALDGEEIETFCSDAETTSLSSVAGPVGSAGRLYVLHEEDWERSVEIMKELSGPVRERIAPLPRKASLPTWLVIGVSAIFIAVLAGVLAN
ncbi:MAG: DUF2007 domain-containing protein [Alphaproteobacteria bacterium]|nr:MAG: DUF2007 domain-containing protein [Alphaproteobacteria bacterium]